MSRLGDWYLGISIGRRLGWAFAVLVALMVAFGAIAIQEMRGLLQQMSNLVEHPFTVVQAVERVEDNVLRMQIEMNELVHSNDAAQILKHESHLDDLEVEFHRNLAIISERFLGAPEQVERVRQELATWRPVRQQIIDLRLQGELEAAETLTLGEGAKELNELIADLDQLNVFANNKAAEFIGNAQTIARNGGLMLTFFLIFAAGFAALVGIVITRSIRRPLAELGQAARDVAAGDLSRQAQVATGDELGHLAKVFNGMVVSIRDKTAEIAQKNEENERLLLNILPEPIAERLKQGEERIADHFPDVTVLFADLAGFTPMSADLPADKLVENLNLIFSTFDETARRHGIEKIKTIGDSYMAVAGLTLPTDDATGAMVAMGLDMLKAIAAINQERGTHFSLRIGINRGPVVAGVIGRSKFIYDLWGDTVNLASRMESHGLEGRVQVTESVYQSIKERYPAEPRGEIDVKGKGKITAYLIGEGGQSGEASF